MREITGVTRKQIVEKTGCPVYTYAYLRDLGRLPLIRSSPGRGSANLYHPDSIQVVVEYLKQRGHEGEKWHKDGCIDGHEEKMPEHARQDPSNSPEMRNSRTVRENQQ